MMSHFKKSALAASAFCGVLAIGALSAPAAMAGPQQFTWNPQWTAPFTGNSNVDTTFTADNLQGSDFAGIHIDQATGAFSEGGIINATTFLLGGGAVSLPHLAQGYALYFAYSGTGTQDPGALTPGSGKFGHFDTLSFTFFEALGTPVGSSSVYTGAPGTGGSLGGGLTNITTLGHGNLILGSSSVSIAENGLGQIAASATANLSFIQDPAAAGFFVAPAVLNVSFVDASNNFDPSIINLCPGTSAGATLDVCITGGVAHATFGVVPTPEPASLGMLAVGLLGLAGVLRLRKSN